MVLGSVSSQSSQTFRTHYISPNLRSGPPAGRNASDFVLFGLTGNAGGRDTARSDSVRDGGQRLRDGGAVAASGLPPGGYAEGQLAPRRRRVQVGGGCIRAGSFFAEPP